MVTPLSISMPSQQGSKAQASAGLNQRAWPAAVDATVWNAYGLYDLLRRAWDCDAHAFPYTVIGDPFGWGPGRWPRLGVDVLGPDSRAVADATYLTSAWLDFDRPDHEPWDPEDGGRGESVAVAALAAAFPDAMAVYSTSAGVRVVHVLSEPVPLRWARWWLRAWVVHAGRVARAAGVDLVLDTTCGEWTRCYRLPRVVRGAVAVCGEDRSLSWTGGAPTAPVVVVRERRLVWWPEGDPTAEDRTGGALAGLGADVSAVLGPDGALPTPSTDWRLWLRDGTHAGRLADLLEKGAPFGPPVVAIGERNPTLKTTLNSLAKQLVHRGTVSPIDLLAIVGRSVLAEAVRDAGAPTLADAWRLAQRAAGEVASRAAAAAAAPDPDDPAPSGVPPGGPDGPAADDGPPPPIVAPRGRDVAYVYDAIAGTYVGPLVGSGVHRALMALQPAVPVLRGRGYRPVADILAAAVDAVRVDAHYPGVPGSAWDPATAVGVAQVFPSWRLEPAYDDGVAGWLSVFLSGGDDPATGALVADRVLDWLATIERLDRPTAALYLDGPPSTGKGLFAGSAAAAWGLHPVAWTEAVGRFNDGLLRSPVVLLDEGVTVSRSESGRFRSLVGESAHRVEAKGRPVVTLVGCPRVIVAANGPDALDLVGSHGADELAAIGGRVLHVTVPQASADYLRALGGRQGTHDWVRDAVGRPGRVPRHIAWLAAHRAVVTGDRFLVTGVPTTWHVRLVTDDPLYAAVLLAIATALAPSGGGAGFGGGGGGGVWVAPASAGPERRPGCVWVNPRALHLRWKALLVEDGHRPVVSSVARACKALACGISETWDVGGIRSDHWPIPGHLVARVAGDAGHADMGRLGSVLALGTPAQPDVAPLAAGGAT